MKLGHFARVLPLAAGVVLMSGLMSGVVQSADEGMPSRFADDGTIHLPAFDLPLSPALSVEARQFLINNQKRPLASFADYSSLKTEQDFVDLIKKRRESLDTKLGKPQSEASAKLFPVKITPATIGGVPVEEIVPADGVAPANKNRVLMNVHGGGFTEGAIYLGRMESIPIASMAKTKVVSINYRQGYEHKFPAASEDVASVYQALLKQYPARNIGLYGCSAGGALTAQATAWILDKKLPPPGAIGIFGAGAGRGTRGDSAYFAPIADGHPVASAGAASAAPRVWGYFSDVKPDNYLANPLKAPPDLLAKFPPTLLISATRAPDMSGAIETHRALTQAGVDASLQVFDGLGHCFIYFPTLPEAQDANATIVRFFDRHLGK